MRRAHGPPLVWCGVDADPRWLCALGVGEQEARCEAVAFLLWEPCWHRVVAAGSRKAGDTPGWPPLALTRSGGWLAMGRGKQEARCTASERGLEVDLTRQAADPCWHPSREDQEPRCQAPPFLILIG